MARSFLTKTESLSSAGYSNKSIVEKYGSIGAFLTKLEEFAELNEEIQEDVVELQNAVEAADEVEAVVEQQETNVAAMEGEEISSEPVKVESDGGEIIEVTPAQPDLSENSTPEEVTDVIVAEETKVERILQRLSRDKVRSKSEILGIYGVSCHKIRTEDIRQNSLYVYKQKMEENKNFLARIWEKISAFFKKIWETIKNFFRGKAVEAKADEIKEKKEELKEVASKENINISDSDFNAKIKDGKVSKPSAALTLYLTTYHEIGDIARNPDKLLDAVKEYAGGVREIVDNLKDKKSSGILGKLIPSVIRLGKQLFQDFDKNAERVEAIKKAVYSELANVSTEFNKIGKAIESSLPRLNKAVKAHSSVMKTVESELESKFGKGSYNIGNVYAYAFNSSSVCFLSTTSFTTIKANIDEGDIRSFIGNVNFNDVVKCLIDMDVEQLAGKIKKNFDLTSNIVDVIVKDIDAMIKNKHEVGSGDPIYDSILGSGISETDADKATKQIHNIVAEFIKRSANEIVKMLTDIVNLILGLSKLYSYVSSLIPQLLSSQNLAK